MVLLSVVVVPLTHPNNPSLTVDCMLSIWLLTPLAYSEDWLYMLWLSDVKIEPEKSLTAAFARSWNLASSGATANNWSWTERMPKRPIRKQARAGGWNM